MLIAVIVLMATLLAVASLMRSVDTNSLIMGTIGFKQGVLQEAERAYVVARAGIPRTVAAQVDAAPAYFASVQPADSRRRDLPAALVADTPTIGTELPAGATGNRVRYVVERLCNVSGVADRGQCLVPGAYTTGGTHDETSSIFTGSGARAAYRLTVRVDGPRNAQAFVQTTIR
ncbi:hypothetical protein DFR29_101181 [Tahibacter aquaticus]|uniref:Type IV pilus assembly protein PilX n=1 Tax=Tahibacter aquaticus TaxID=520092 RepID=A0A4R6Z9H7_9GAMM|nr:hypothetical protein [Tahibacter aquaticus]TDR48561.1 hypothetical protein DFR29_101181 [Tahibacter aquaticus]